MPSFSKDCFGGFVLFQRVAIDPNEKFSAPNFLPHRMTLRLRSSDWRATGRQFGMGENHWRQLSANSIFRKHKLIKIIKPRKLPHYLCVVLANAKIQDRWFLASDGRV
jgi:hypothetical protein